MTAPPGCVPTSMPNPPAKAERADRFLHPKVVQREAAKVLAARGIRVRPVVLRRLVTGFIRHGHTTSDTVEAFILGYLDPTGETAVSNVMRRRE